MTPEEGLNALFTAHQKSNMPLSFGIGTATEITDESCTVEREGRPPLYDVRFQAGGELLGSNYTLRPKDGSAILYAIIDNQPTEAAILVCSEIDKATIKIGSTIHEISADGHLIKKGTDTLSKVVSDFIAEVKKIIVLQGTSPNVPALEAIDIRLKQLLQ